MAKKAKKKSAAAPVRKPRADAARNRQVLLATAREMLAELGADKITMDALADLLQRDRGHLYADITAKALTDADATKANIIAALRDIADKATQLLVDQFNFLRTNAVEPLSKFLDYITSVY